MLFSRMSDLFDLINLYSTPTLTMLDHQTTVNPLLTHESRMSYDKNYGRRNSADPFEAMRVSSQTVSRNEVHDPSAPTAQNSVPNSNYTDPYAMNRHTPDKISAGHDTTQATVNLPHKSVANTAAMLPPPAVPIRGSEPESKPKRWKRANRAETTEDDITQNQYVQDGKKPAKKGSYLTELYRAAKDIYQAGPQGEGQALWSWYKQHRKEKQMREVVFEICSYQCKEAICDESGKRCTVWPTTQLNTRIVPEDVVRPKSRQDSATSSGNVSCTSREVPITFRQPLVGRDKPLPSTPQLHTPTEPARGTTKGKVLNLNKPLPRTPLPCSPDMPEIRENPVVVPPTNPSSSSLHTDKVDSRIEYPQGTVVYQNSPAPGERTRHNAQEMQTSTWSKNAEGTTAKPQLISAHTPASDKVTKAHAALKAKISRPILVPPTVNVSLSKGGIGGIGTTPPSSPPHSPQRLGTATPEVHGKQQEHSFPLPIAWLDMFPHPPLPTIPTIHKSRKRPDSDKSFACQGLVEENATADYEVHSEPSTQDDGSRVREDEDTLVPEPLFSGVGGFADSYYDVEDVYADQRRTGRWI